MKWMYITFFSLAVCVQSFSQSTWTSVRDNGADPEGRTSCTGIINHLIDSVASTGGGTIYFPAGTWFTGPIFMKSNITIYVDAGAVIKFSDDFDDYLPMVPSRWEDVRVKTFASQIYAYQCENIAIRGDGHFEGQGKKWWDFWNQAKTGQPADTKWQHIFRAENADLLQKIKYLADKNAFLRPPMVTTYECKNVLIEGVSFSNPPFWTIMPTFSDNVTIEGITIENPDYSPNTDGIDLSSCTNVHISNSHITVGDDCIVIKSGRDEDGREAARPTENLTITNCTMLKGHGGVVIGSEMSGNVKRVAISNCVFEGTDVGIRIKTMRGRGGIVEDVRVSNIVMYDMVKEGVIITMRYQPTEPEPVSERTPMVRNVNLSGIIMRNANRAIAIYGLTERDVTQIAFSDMHINAKKGILVENASDVSFHDIQMEVNEGTPFEARDSKQISYDRVQIIAPTFNKPVIKLSNCQDIRITGCYQPEAIPLFMQEDEKCSGIYFVNNIMPGTDALFAKRGTNILAEFNLLGGGQKSVNQTVREPVEKWSVRMANAVLSQNDSLIYYLNAKQGRWQYDVAFLGQAIDRLGDIDPKYSKYMKDYIDYFIRDDGSVIDYKMEEYNLDRINPAKNIITLYKRTGDSLYRKALDQFVTQMKSHPKTNAGGYWHKKIYPWQMWLDGIYMASPFLAQYAREFNAPEWFDVVSMQIELVYNKTLDSKTGLLYHAWDESHTQKWCNPETGQSKYPWSRAMGWYTMAIVDVLDFLPRNHPERDSLITILQRTCEALLSVRDARTGLWYQVLNQGGREGNYIEGSGSAMFTYAFAKGAHKGYLDKKYLDVANETFDSIIKELITTDESGLVTMHNICGGCGLGGNPYRNGSYEYYIHEKRVDNDSKGVAPFILAAIELDK